MNAHSKIASLSARRIDLSRTFIRKGDLSYANLAGANFSHADCSNANFRGANFKDAVLTGTILAGADLSEAVNLTREQVGAAIIDANTILPVELR